jgi:hypothetical protein
MIARDIMGRHFHSLRPESPIADAVRRFHSAGKSDASPGPS